MQWSRHLNGKKVADYLKKTKEMIKWLKKTRD